MGGEAVFTNSSRTARIVASCGHVDDEDRQLDDVRPVRPGGAERPADVRERRSRLRFPPLRQRSVGLDRHLAGGPYEVPGRKADDMAVAGRRREILGRREPGFHVAGPQVDLRRQLVRLVRGLELVARSRVEVDVGGGQRHEGHGQGVHDPGDDVQERKRRLGEKDQQRAEEGAGRERNRSSDPDEGSHPQPPAACTSSPLRRRASIARTPSTSTTCAASAQRTPIQTATGIPIPVAVRVIHATARIPDAPSSGRHRVTAMPVRLDGIDVTAFVEADERADRGALDEREAEQRQGRADQD